jgi:DNA mismatch repair protein MutS
MVEMLETSMILHNLSSRSLVLLDEIGRGTSTYDGMSIARAIVEYVHEYGEGAKTLFATHYHELSVIENELSNVKNYNIAVKKRGDQMIFLRKIIPGSTDDSFGVEVAKLAGLPDSVVRRAREILKGLENGESPKMAKAPVFDEQVSMEDLRSRRVCDALSEMSVETLTPIEAMNALYQLKKMLE